MIYLDNASTTKVYDEVIQLTGELWRKEYFNPSATYKPSFGVRSAIADARRTLADFLCAQENEIYFTSCATESNNWALKTGCKNKNGNIVVSAGEHASVYESAMFLRNKGQEVRFAKLLKNGMVDKDDLLSKVDDNTTLVSVLHVSNETGVINDIADICRRVKQIKSRIIFHSDGVQAFLKTNTDVKAMGVDLYSVSGHKFHAMKGVGMIYINKSTHLYPLIHGGGQESGLRSGTENVAGIVGMAKAAEIYKSQYDKNKIDDNYDFLTKQLLSNKDCLIIGSDTDNTKLICAFSALGCKAEILQSMLAERGVIVGRGSACSSHHSGNRVLGEMQLDKKIIAGTLRISLLPTTTRDEIATACQNITECINLLRGNNIG